MSEWHVKVTKWSKALDITEQTFYIKSKSGEQDKAEDDESSKSQHALHKYTYI